MALIASSPPTKVVTLHDSSHGFFPALARPDISVPSPQGRPSPSSAVWSDDVNGRNQMSGSGASARSGFLAQGLSRGPLAEEREAPQQVSAARGEHLPPPKIAWPVTWWRSNHIRRSLSTCAGRDERRLVRAAREPRGADEPHARAAVDLAARRQEPGKEAVALVLGRRRPRGRELRRSLRVGAEHLAAHGVEEDRRHVSDPGAELDAKDVHAEPLVVRGVVALCARLARALERDRHR